MAVICSPEQILDELGVNSPEDIDIEAIAWSRGALVKYRELRGCEARIVGRGTKAIITINSKSSETRQRFSIAHELGHWELHRGKKLACSGFEAAESPQSAERSADQFASRLLMPANLLRPLLVDVAIKDFNAIEKIASEFKASRSAMAFRITELSDEPILLAAHGRNGMKWHRRSKTVDDALRLRPDLDTRSSAFDLLFKGHFEKVQPRRVAGSVWFTGRNAERRDVYEHAIRTSPEEVLVLLRVE